MIKAFVYVEAQVSVPFGEFPWKDNNPGIKSQAGLISKLFLTVSQKIFLLMLKYATVVQANKLLARRT